MDKMEISTTNSESVTAEVQTEAVQEKKLEALGDRMKSYEKQHAHKIDKTLPFIIRLDGHKFSTFTRPFKRPYDERFANAMLATASALLLAYNPITVYTFSDEITLIFPATGPEVAVTTADADAEAANPGASKKGVPQLMFDGKLQKLVSLTASFASVTFFKHLKEQPIDQATEPRLYEHVMNAMPHFDSRAFNVPSDVELLNNLVWRSHHDARRNSISGLAQTHFPKNSTHKMSCAQMLEKLTAHGIDWTAQPEHFKFGSILKREKYLLHTADHKGNPVSAMRTRPVTRSFEIKFSVENLNYVIAKYADSPDSLAAAAAALESPTTTTTTTNETSKKQKN